MLRVSKNLQSTQEGKSQAYPSAKARENHIQGHGCWGDQLSPAPPSVSPGEARGGVDSDLPALSMPQLGEETYIHLKKIWSFFNYPDWKF